MRLPDRHWRMCKSRSKGYRDRKKHWKSSFWRCRSVTWRRYRQSRKLHSRKEASLRKNSGSLLCIRTTIGPCGTIFPSSPRR